jgi:AcrR family transcriptional regulator
MGRPKEHNETTRAELLVAAERLIEDFGPAAASVRAVAEAVGTTTRAVYSVFGSKDGLVDALATRLFEILGDAIDTVALTDDPVADLIEASLLGFRQTALDHRHLYGLVFLRVIPDLHLGPGVGEVASATFARLESLVARILAVWAPSGLTPNEAALAVHALTEGLATMELRGRFDGAADAERIWRAALGSLLRGFAG